MTMSRYKSRIRPALRYVHLALILAFASKTATAQFIGPGPGGVAESTAPVALPETSTLLPGDLLEVRIFGVTGFDFKGRLTDDGTVTIPLAGTLKVAGLTVGGAERILAARLMEAELVNEPQVNIFVLESPSHVATVSGEVVKAGPVSIYGEKRLLDVLSSAGGFTPASSPTVTIYRRGVQQPFQVEIPADPSGSDGFNIVIAPGDNIVVGKLGVIYVLGAFHVQGAIPLKSTTPLTLIQAMSMAGGVNYEAAMDKAYVLRSVPGGRQEIRFNVADVVHRRVPDIALQNDDVVLVPPNALKAALKGGAAGVAASLLAGVGYIVVTR